MISYALANKLLDHTLRNSAYTAPTTVYAALFTTHINPEDAIGTPTEVSGGGYARQAVTFGTAASAGRIANTAVVTFPAPTANWGTIKAVALVSSASGVGDILFFANICPRTVNSGDVPPSFPVGGILAALGDAEISC